MGIHLYRIDDRLIHGQVVVGWGQPLNARFLILVDDLVASSDWEKELYRMAVPPEMDIYFADLQANVVVVVRIRASTWLPTDYDLRAPHDAHFGGRQRLSAACLRHDARDVGIRSADWGSRGNAR